MRLYDLIEAAEHCIERSDKVCGSHRCGEFGKANKISEDDRYRVVVPGGVTSLGFQFAGHAFGHNVEQQFVGEVALLDKRLKRWAANTPRVFETFNWESASEDFKHVYRNLLDAGVE
jgi:hypothetical protein